MADLPAMPTAEHVARIIVAACKATNENPLYCAKGRSSYSRARCYAFVALAVAFPELTHAVVARLVGAAEFPTFVASTVQIARKRPAWWSLSIVNDCLAAIAHAPASEAQAECRRIGSTYSRPIPKLSPLARVVDRRPAGPVSLGDPAPGRSALDQGYTPGSGLLAERSHR